MRESEYKLESDSQAMFPFSNPNVSQLEYRQMRYKVLVILGIFKFGIYKLKLR